MNKKYEYRGKHKEHKLHFKELAQCTVRILWGGSEPELSRHACNARSYLGK